MRKALLCLFSLIMIIVFVSCGSEPKPAPGPEPGPEPGPQEITFDIIVPWDGIDSSSRGLTNLVVPGSELDPGVDILSGDIEYAEAVMQCMPIFPTMKTISGVKESSPISSLDLEINMYGFKGVPDLEKSRVNSDGIYVIYNILEGENEVGIIEYYYNYKEHKMSYRQYMMLTVLVPLGPTPSDIKYNNSVMVFCLDDVTVNEDGSFVVNQFKSDGTLETRQAYTDYFLLGDNMPGPNSKNINLERRIITMKSENGVTSSFSQPWASYTGLRNKNWADDELRNDSLRDLLVETLELENPTEVDDYLALTPEKTAKLDAEAAIGFIKLLYTNGEHVAKGGWTSYEAFMEKSLWDFNRTDHTWLINDSEDPASNPFKQGTLSTMVMWMSYFDLEEARKTPEPGQRKAGRAYNTLYMYGVPTYVVTAYTYNSCGWSTLIPDDTVTDYNAAERLMKNYIPLCVENTSQEVIDELVNSLIPPT